MIRTMTVFVLIVALVANAVAHGLIMAAPAAASQQDMHGHLVRTGTSEIPVHGVSPDQLDDRRNGCCGETGDRVDSSHLSCVADCSFLIFGAAPFGSNRNASQVEQDATALSGDRTSYLFRPPKNASQH